MAVCLALSLYPLLGWVFLWLLALSMERLGLRSGLGGRGLLQSGQP
jgi:hypothetical protein